jgi:hypothetical protein
MKRFLPGGTRVVPVREFLSARERSDRAIERAFFAALLLRNGVYKTTEERRMDDLLPMLVARARTIEARPLRVLDVACSSGVTTVELHRALAAAGLPVETVGTDLTLEADLVERADGAAMLFDSRGALLQVELPGWASPWRFRPSDRVWHPLGRARAGAGRARDRGVPRRAWSRGRGLTGTRVALLAGAALAEPDVAFVEEDIPCRRLRGRSTWCAWRTCSPGYFDPATLARMVSAVAGRVAPGGLLLILRSDGSPPVHHGTLFRRGTTGFAGMRPTGPLHLGHLVGALDIPYNGASHALRSS